MKIKKMKIDEIQTSKYNPRKDLRAGDAEYEKLKASIEHFELVEPLVVNIRTNTLISGHQRLKVCKDLGYEKIDVVVVDLDEKHEKLLNLNLNKTGSDWDYLKLEELFSEFEPEELEITGFDDEEIERITSMFLEPEDDYDANEAQEESLKPVSASDKFKVYMSFDTKEKAEEFLFDEGFSKEFKNGKKKILIKMESVFNED